MDDDVVIIDDVQKALNRSRKACKVYFQELRRSPCLQLLQQIKISFGQRLRIIRRCERDDDIEGVDNPDWSEFRAGYLAGMQRALSYIEWLGLEYAHRLQRRRQGEQYPRLSDEIKYHDWFVCGFKGQVKPTKQNMTEEPVAAEILEGIGGGP